LHGYHFLTAKTGLNIKTTQYVQPQNPIFGAIKLFIMRIVFVLVCTLFTVAIANAQPTQVKKVIADKIVGQVGDRVILRSDVYNAIADVQRQGGQLPPNPQCELMENLLIQKALVLQAEKDSLTVGEDELDALLDNQVRGFIQQYGSKEVLEEIAGKSIYQIKEDFREPFRERELAKQMQNKILGAVKITPTEVKAWFNKIPKDSLPFYESEIEVSQIIVYPKANRDVESYVTRQLNNFKKQIEDGTGKFDLLAKQYSEDPGSKDNGGQYNINRNDKFWDPAFLAASFRLKEGQVSNVVKSKFGLHIIQQVSRAGDDAVVRHILRIPPVTDDEVKESVAKLDSLRQNIVSGNIKFAEAVNKYSEDDNSKFNGGAVQDRDGSTYVTIDQLDKDMVLAIKNMKVGEVSKPVAFTDERNRKAVRLILLKTRTEPHRENMRDDYNKIAQKALDEKKEESLAKWFKEHLPKYYILVDKEFANCDNLKDWYAVSNSATAASN